MESNSNDFENYEEVEEYESGEVTAKHAIFPTANQIIIGFILIILILIIFEKIFISLFLYFIPSYTLLIIVWTIIHLYFLHYLAYTCIFPGRNIFVDFYLRTVFGKIRAKSFSQSLERFKTRIDKVLQASSNEEKRESSYSSQNFNKSKVSSKYVETYEKIKEKYGELNSYAQEFLNLLVTFKTKIENSSLQENFRKYFHKEQVFLNEKDKKDYELIKEDAKKIQKILSDIQGEFKFNINGIKSYLKNLFFNDILKSKEFTRVSALIKKPNSKEIIIINKDNKKLDTLLIFSNKKEEKICSNNIVIVCGPNLTPFENLINSWDIDSLYLSNDTDILFWNYRGYGFSEGNVDFDNICEDVICIYDYISTNFQYNKIAVHGLSIGGVPACYLASKRNISLLIADRTFGNIKEILDNFPMKVISYYLAKIIFINFVDNTQKFMQSNCKKIIMNDTEDKTVIDPICLKTSIAKKIIYQFFKIKHTELNIRNIDSCNILDYALEPYQSKEIFNAFKYTIDFLKKKNKSGNDIVLEKLSKNGSFDEKCQKLNDYEENLETNNYNKNISMKEITDIFYNKIKNIYSHFWGVGDSLERFCDFQNTKTHFNNFFNNLVVYGPEDLSLQDYSLCNVHYVDESLGNFITECEKFLNSDEVRQFTDYIIYKKLHFFVDCVKCLKVYLLGLHLEENDQEWMKELKGILIPLYCGHILFYDEKELETLKYLVKDALTNYDIIIPSVEK